MRILLTGASGTLGLGLITAATAAPGLTLLPAARRPARPGWVRLDLADPASIDAALVAARPDAVLHAGAVTRPGWAEANPDQAFRVNHDGTRHLAERAAERGIRLVAVSTDLVFPGRAGGAYREADTERPLSIYGSSKLAGEQAALAAHPAALVVRTSLLVGGDPADVARLVPGYADGVVALYDDERRSPILTEDLARALLELSRSAERGVLHLAGPQSLTRFELALALARVLGLDARRLRPASRRDAPPPPRPGDVSLDSSMALALLKTPIRVVEAGLQAGAGRAGGRQPPASAAR